MDVLIAVLVLALVAVVIFYVIDLLPLPHPIGIIAKIIVALVVLIKLLGLIGINVGSL